MYGEETLAWIFREKLHELSRKWNCVLTIYKFYMYFLCMFRGTRNFQIIVGCRRKLIMFRCFVFSSEQQYLSEPWRTQLDSQQIYTYKTNNRIQPLQRERKNCLNKFDYNITASFANHTNAIHKTQRKILTNFRKHLQSSLTVCILDLYENPCNAREFNSRYENENNDFV